MEDYQTQDWVALYQSALIELEQARLPGRINAAQKAIIARVEVLHSIELHADEHHAIDDALRSLKLLEREEARLTGAVDLTQISLSGK
jgi:hypothetical protein